MKNQKQYPLNQSPLYKVTSPRRLSDILHFDLGTLEKVVSDQKSNYKIFPLAKTNGKKRMIEAPKHPLKRIQKRICDLLSRIDSAEYLHSATKGRSYITNAKKHVGCKEMIKLDIKNFYPSVKQSSIYQFFFKTMGCASDVAGILAKILAFDNHLCTGSSASTLVSFLANKKMFDEIYQKSIAKSLQMTTYVDDICISGESTSRAFLYEIGGIIVRNGYRSHKWHRFTSEKRKLVTGVIVGSDRIYLPNRRHKNIKDDRAELDCEPDNQKKIKILTRLIGRIHEAAQIDSATWLPRAQKPLQLRRKLIKESFEKDQP